MILNKQIIGQLKESVNQLSDILNSKDDLLNDMKKNLNKDELKEFNAVQKLVQKKLKEKDFNGAFRTIQKFKKDHESKKDSDESKEE